MSWSRCTFVLLSLVAYCAADNDIICENEDGLLEYPAVVELSWNCNVEDQTAECTKKTADCSSYRTSGEIEEIKILVEEVETFDRGVDPLTHIEWATCIEECNKLFKNLEDHPFRREIVLAHHQEYLKNQSRLEIECYLESTTSEDTLGCADGSEAPRWDGCIDDGSYRVRCPKYHFPCNELRGNGKEFRCGTDCSTKAGKRSDCIEEIKCYSESTTSKYKLGCASGNEAERWDGCIDEGSYRVRCPKYHFPCNELRANGKEFRCGTDCETHDGKRSDCIEELSCYTEPTTSKDTLECANGKEAERWDGCIDQGSYRVRCPKGHYPCNNLRENGKEFYCSLTCSSSAQGGKRTDCIGGDVLLLYENKEEAGRSLSIYGPQNLKQKNFDNLVSSVHAIKGDWELYENSDSSGLRMIVKEGQKINAFHNDKYSSARPICQYYNDPSTAKLKAYEHISSQGKMKEYLNEVAELEDLHDKISSVHVVKGDWELYEQVNFEGVRKVVKEGEQKDIHPNNFVSSLRPICETYTYSPKCKPVRIEILDNPNSHPKFKGTQIIGAASGFSCNDPSTKTLTLNSVNSLTKSIGLGISTTEGTDWSVGASVTIETSVKFLGSGTSVSGTISGSTGGSSSVTHEETESFTTGDQSLVGSSTTYATPGAAIAFGAVDIYETDNSDFPVKIHLDCDGKKKEKLSTMKLTSRTFQSASFWDFVKEINAENCSKDGYITKIVECIRNVEARYINGFGEQEKMRKDFNDCFA